MSLFKKAIGAAVGYKVYKNQQPPTIVTPPGMTVVGMEKKGVLGSEWRVKYILDSNKQVTQSFTCGRGTSAITGIGGLGRVAIYWN
jgi:hypothetical protein